MSELMAETAQVDPWSKPDPPWPLGVVDPTCPDGHDIAENTDRRLLWHIETTLVVTGTTDAHRTLARKLARHLHETCEHHWHNYSGYHGIPAVWQCLWCNEVVTEKPENMPVGGEDDA